MELTLGPNDLAAGHENSSQLAVTFDKLTRQAQAAVQAVGLATFVASDKETRYTIYAPS